MRVAMAGTRPPDRKPARADGCPWEQGRVMSEEPGFSIASQEADDGTPGATAAFPFDRLTVERFRSAFPRARWRDDLRAWFVPGQTAGRRLDRWLGREMSGVLAHADERGRDAFAFEPVESRYLEAAEELRVRTPYSRTVVDALRAVPWAWWDGELKAWRIPFRSWEELRKRWPEIEAAARRSEPAERLKAGPARQPADAQDLARGWGQPSLDELRVERRRAASRDRSLDTRRRADGCDAP